MIRRGLMSGSTQQLSDSVDEALQSARGPIGRAKVTRKQTIAQQGSYIVVDTDAGDVELDFAQWDPSTTDNILTVRNKGPNAVYIRAPRGCKFNDKWTEYPMTMSHPPCQFIAESANCISIVGGLPERLWFEWNQRDTEQLTFFQGANVTAVATSLQTILGTNAKSIQMNISGNTTSALMLTAAGFVTTRKPPTKNYRVEADYRNIALVSTNFYDAGPMVRWDTSTSTGFAAHYANTLVGTHVIALYSAGVQTILKTLTPTDMLMAVGQGFIMKLSAKHRVEVTSDIAGYPITVVSGTSITDPGRPGFFAAGRNDTAQKFRIRDFKVFLQDEDDADNAPY
jgi:hypothetical protein